jgi:WD40 repeat protein
VSAAVFSADGKSIYTSGAGGSVKLWDVKKLIATSAKRAQSGDATVSAAVEPPGGTTPQIYVPTEPVPFDIFPR